MRKGSLLIFFIAAYHFSAGQLRLTSAAPSTLIDFSSSTTDEVGTIPGSPFAGAGFAPNPNIPGMLNSNAWAVTGWSDGILDFGGSNIVGDYARGTTNTAETIGGFYAYTGSPGSVANPSLLIQPTVADFTPGTLTLRIQNNDATDIITKLVVSYNLYIRNDQDKSNSFNFSYSSDNVTYTTVSAMDYSSPATSDGLGWVIVGSAPSRATTISGLNIPPGSFVYIRWSGDEISGSGSMDEFGLDDINIVATFTPLSTDYYQSATTGNWNDATIWETSPNNLPPWSPAILPPSYFANAITIQGGHTVTINSTASADQLVVEASATLELPNLVAFTVNNGVGTDMTVHGRFILNGTQPTGGGSIEISSGALVKVNDNQAPSESDDFAFANPNVTFLTGCTYEWATTLTPAWKDKIYFTAGQNTTYKFSKTPSFGLGGSDPTIVYGTLQADVPITLGGTADKTFVNGITGAGDISPDLVNPFSGNVIINGTTAMIGGPGALILPSTELQIGSASGTVATLISDKLIDGNIYLLPFNTFVDIVNNTLTVTGNISGGTPASYIRTGGTGFLKINTIGVTARIFPVGNATYNPVTVGNGSMLDWKVNVEDVLTVEDPWCIPNIPKAVLRTWNVLPSINPLTTGADITFSWNDDPAALPRQTGMSYNNSEDVQIWRKIMHIPPTQDWNYDWIAVGVTQAPGGVVNDYRTATATGWKQFSPFAVSTLSGPLPVILVDFNVVKKSSTEALITWQLAQCCSKDARFEIEKSMDNRNFVSFARVHGSEINRFYSYPDNHLEKGITYYRLKMIDVDGKTSYSKTVTILNEIKRLFIVSFSPSPVTSNATIVINNIKEEAINFVVYNAAGIAVKQWQQKLPEGNSVLSFDAGHLKAGVYFLSAVSPGNHTIITFVKQ